MLYYKFKNYEEFKELFGIVKHGNGNKSRKNKILLAFIKNKELLHNAVVSGNYTLLHISDITTMKNEVTERIIRSGGEDETLPYCVNLIGKTYYSSTYGTDGNKGLCEDGDMKAVRYINYYCCPIKIYLSHKNKADFICEVSLFLLDFCRQTKLI